MKLPGWIKGLVVGGTVVLLVVGLLSWKYALPKAEELKEKDPDKYAALVDAATGLHTTRAKALYRELDAMTYEDVLTLRYSKWKDKKDADREFRFEEWEKELELRQENKKLKKEKHRQQQKVLMRDLNRSDTAEALFIGWKEAGPWERGLLLREKCIKYLKLEKEEDRRQANVRQVSRTMRLLNLPRGQQLHVAELCENLVPIAHDPKVVEAALISLKNNINYFFFVQLLDEIGVPRKTVFSFPIQLDHMTGDFFDS